MKMAVNMVIMLPVFTGKQVECWEVVCAEPCSGVSHSRSLPSPPRHFNYGQFFVVCLVTRSRAVVRSF